MFRLPSLRYLHPDFPGIAMLRKLMVAAMGICNQLDFWLNLATHKPQLPLQSLDTLNPKSCIDELGSFRKNVLSSL